MQILKRITLSVLCIAGSISVFLPWIKLPVAGIKEGIELDHWWAVPVIFTTALLSFNLEYFFPKQKIWLYLTGSLASLTAALGGIYKLQEAIAKLESYTSKIDMIPVFGKWLKKTIVIQVEYGYYVMVVSGFAIFALGIFFLILDRIRSENIMKA